MKKILLIVASLASMVLVSCTKAGDESSVNFSKAEIVFEVTNTSGQPVSADFWNYVTFTVKGKDFNNASFSKTVDGSISKYAITCTTAPTDDKDCEADFSVIPVLGTVPESVTVDYAIKVSCFIYDTDGNQVYEGGQPVSSTLKGTVKSSIFVADFKKPVTNSHFVLYKRKAKQPYSFSWKPLD